MNKFVTPDEHNSGDRKACLMAIDENTNHRCELEDGHKGICDSPSTAKETEEAIAKAQLDARLVLDAMRVASKGKRF